MARKEVFVCDQCRTIQEDLTLIYGAVFLDVVEVGVTRGPVKPAKASQSRPVGRLPGTIAMEKLTFCSISCFTLYVTERCQSVVTEILDIEASAEDTPVREEPVREIDRAIEVER